MKIIEVINIIIDTIILFYNKILLLIGGIISLIFYLTGGEDKMTNCLLILMAVDYITGLSKAYCTKTLNSKTGFKGIIKKIVMICMIVLAYQIDILMGNVGIKNLTIGILISNEGLSILENCSICGVPIPKKLKELLEQYRGNKG